MEQYEILLSTIALTLGVSWASGINLYAVLLVLGIGGYTGNIDLPKDLHILQSPIVILAAGIMYVIEFFVDKIPGVDSGWDTVHTFIRIPAGAILAAGAVGDVSPALQMASGILGGGLSATSHATKAGSRLLINTSPEPLSNWSASLLEDFVVLSGLWAAFNHPVVFLSILVFFIAFAIWLLPRILYAFTLIIKKIGTWLGLTSHTHTRQYDHPNFSHLIKLKQLLDQGVLTSDEFEKEKEKLLKAGIDA